MHIQRSLLLTTLLVAGLSVSACCSTPTPEVSSNAVEVTNDNDPFEPVNRVIFDFNDFLDRLLIGPLAGFYQVMVPPGLRDRVSNMIVNLDEPVNLANNLLQGDFTKAGISFSRLAVNSTMGVGGMFEVADEFDLPIQKADFGQTLYTWGAGEGPYLVLPLYGPSNVRDGIGVGADVMISPWQYAVANGGSDVKNIYTYTTLGAVTVSKRESVLEAYDALREGSLDFYAQMRSIYRQHRAKVLGEPLSADAPKFEDFDEIPAAAPAGK